MEQEDYKCKAISAADVPEGELTPEHAPISPGDTFEHFTQHPDSLFTVINPNTLEASRRRVEQRKAPHLPINERQGIMGDKRPADCPRCQGRLNHCPMHGEDWRLCPHAT